MGKSIYSLPTKPSGLENALASFNLRSRVIFIAVSLLCSALIVVIFNAYVSARDRSFLNNNSMQLEYVYKDNPRRSAETNAIIQAVRESTNRTRTQASDSQTLNQSSSQTNDTSDNASNYQLTINGEPIDVPRNGTVSHTTDNGNVSVQIQSHNTQASEENNTRTRNSSSISIKSSTKSTVTGQQNQEVRVR